MGSFFCCVKSQVYLTLRSILCYYKSKVNTTLEEIMKTGSGNFVSSMVSPKKNWEDPLESPVRRSMQWKRENLIHPSGLPTI